MSKRGWGSPARFEKGVKQGCAVGITYMELQRKPQIWELGPALSQFKTLSRKICHTDKRFPLYPSCLYDLTKQPLFKS